MRYLALALMLSGCGGSNKGTGVGRMVLADIGAIGGQTYEMDLGSKSKRYLASPAAVAALSKAAMGGTVIFSYTCGWMPLCQITDVYAIDGVMTADHSSPSSR